MRDCERDAKQRYRQKIKELRVELYPTDEDIKDRLAERVEAGEPKATYIKRLIREDIQRKEFMKQYKNTALSPTLNSNGQIVEVSLMRTDGANDEN